MCRAVSAALHTPQFGGPALSQVVQNTPPVTALSSRASFDHPNLNMNHSKTVRFAGPLKKKVHSNHFGPFESNVAPLCIAIAVEPIWTQDWLLYTLQLRSGARGKCVACLLLNTPVFMTLTVILYDNIIPIEHVLYHLICVPSHLMCACKHCNVKLSLYCWTHCSCWWVYHFKKHRCHAIFHTNWTYRSTKKTDLDGKKTQRETWSHAEKRLFL